MLDQKSIKIIAKYLESPNDAEMLLGNLGESIRRTIIHNRDFYGNAIIIAQITVEILNELPNDVQNEELLSKYETLITDMKKADIINSKIFRKINGF